MPKDSSRAFGIDVGGTGVKAALVNVKRGVLLTERVRLATPQPATPEAVARAVARIVRRYKWRGPVGCTVPARVRHGTVETASNIDQEWIGTDASRLFRRYLRLPVAVLNDADAAGLAEMRYGAGRECEGVCLVLTFGTGIGSALFARRRLVQNTELGHLQLAFPPSGGTGRVAEHMASNAAREREELTWEDWARERVQPYLDHVEFLFAPDLIVIGGGVSRPDRWERYGSLLQTRARLAPAALGNTAGIVGAALAARILAVKRERLKKVKGEE